MLNNGQALTNNSEPAITVSKTQEKFLKFCEKFGWGKLEVTIVNGQPVASKEIERTHRHDT